MEPLYDIISPLRVLLSPADAKEAFFGLESHFEKWKEDEGFVESHEAIVDTMKASLGFEDAEQASVQRPATFQVPMVRNDAAFPHRS